MKTLRSLLVALTLISPAVLAAATFEGTVKMKMSGPNGKAIPLTYMLKGGLSRVELQAEGQTMATIVEPARQQATILMPEQKMYMVHSFAGIQQQAGAADDTTFEQTDVREKILGYDTTKYIARSKGTTTEIWATEELGGFGGIGGGGNPMGGRGGPKGQAWESLLRGKAMFPLRVVSTEKGSKESFRLEATDVKKESLPDSLFTPPADYQKFDMGGMMRGMGLPGMGK